MCRANDVLYIADEVVTGFGRLGHWFASEDVFGIRPDMITCAKGLTSGYLPLGACLISDRLLEPISGPGQTGGCPVLSTATPIPAIRSPAPRR